MMKVYVRNVLNQPVGLIAFKFSPGDYEGKKTIVLSMSYSRCSGADKFDKYTAIAVANKRMQESPVNMCIRHGLTEREVACLFDEMGIPYDSHFENYISELVRVVNTELVCYLLYLLGCNDTASAKSRFEENKVSENKSAKTNKEPLPKAAKTMTVADVIKKYFSDINTSTTKNNWNDRIVIDGPVTVRELSKILEYITNKEKA